MSIHKPPVIKRHIRLQNSSTKVIYRAITDLHKLRNSHKVEIATIKGQPSMVRETGTY
jgi:hypothetical protein